MHRSHSENYSILSCHSVETKIAKRLLIIGIIGLAILFNPTYLRITHLQGSASPYETGTSSYASVSSAGALDLVNANVNASANSAYNQWTSNSTNAQATINSSDAQGVSLSAVWRLNQTVIEQAQIIKYDFDLATRATNSGSSFPAINATVALTSSDYEGWYSQSQTPIYPNDTETITVSNIEGHYTDGSQRNSLIFAVEQVTNAQASSSGGINTVLFQRETPQYAAGDGLFHHYTIEIDLQSDRTIWITDNTIIATFQLSFVPSNLDLITTASGSGDSAIATLRDPVQTPTLSIATGIVTIGPGQLQIANFTSSSGQISSLQNQINQLNGRVGNLTSQNAQFQTRTSQWFSQWWAGIIWGVLGAALVGFLFVTETHLRARRKTGNGETGTDSICSQCGGTMPSGATFCGECGTMMRELTLSCPECGQQMPAASSYCGDCGGQISADDSALQNAASTSPSASPEEKEGSWR